MGKLTKLFVVVMVLSLSALVVAQSAQSELKAMNAKLKSKGLAIFKAELIVVNNGELMGTTVYANDRTHLLDAQWVPGDPNRNADGNNLTQMTFDPWAWANGAVNTEPIIDTTFNTWERAVKNGKLNIVKRQYTGDFPLLVTGLVGLTPEGNPYLADIVNAGYLPGWVFTTLWPEDGEYILGVTFTLVWIDSGTGEYTDMNGDGYLDIALKEIWYNDSFDWIVDGSSDYEYDIETVVLHENGHALGLGHFGKMFRTLANGEIHIAPRAVMNAIYFGVLHTPLGTDRAGLNHIYGNWPK